MMSRILETLTFPARLRRWSLISLAWPIAFRYMRSRKRSTVSLITAVAVVGVALGVGALLAVLSISSGFQDEFRNKVLGVNAHVLVMKHGVDFTEYRDVIHMVRRMPEVRGAGPFLINEMMLTKGDRISGVLVKGIDPTVMKEVLDLPNQIIAGTTEGLRLAGAAPPRSDQELLLEPGPSGTEDLDAYLRALDAPDAGPRDAAIGVPSNIPGGEVPSGTMVDAEPVVVDALPTVDVPTPEEAEAALAALEQAALPSDEEEARAFAPSVGSGGAAGRGVGTAAHLPGMIVGKTLAANIGLHVGDQVRVVSPLAGLDVSMWSPTARTPRSREFRIVGIFEAGFQEYDTRLVYVDLYEAEAFFDQGDSVTGVEITLHDIDKAGEVSARLERELGNPALHTVDWQTLNYNLFTALKIQKIMLTIVIATVIFVAAFCVVATLIMVVLEKKREIAILKAMGTKDHTVLGVFVMQGTLIAGVGVLIGLLLGGGACFYLTRYEFPLDPKVYLIDHLPVRTSPAEFVWTVVIAFAISIAATLIPSIWASRLLPADGVRYE